MSTRARTRAAAAAATATASTSIILTMPPTKAKSNPRKTVKQEPQNDALQGESHKPISSSRTPALKKTKQNAPKVVYCICSRGDDGSPMIRCSECKLWYHFICVDISERDAEEINVYICSPCTQSTGRKTAMTWEGPEALEDCGSDVETITLKTKPKKSAGTKALPIPPSESESDHDDGSGDEYIADEEIKGKVKRRPHRVSSSGSESGSESDADQRRLSRYRVSRSRTPMSPVIPNKNSRLKRRISTAERPPPSKRKRSDTVDDPTRKYCLGKLEELFQPVFLRYPHVRIEKTEEVDHSGDDQKPTILSKPLEELTEEEKEALINESKQFAADLEQCVFEIYAEPDKSGQPHASGKYKDRFRMLQFNLSKVDRVVIHQRIVSASITPKEISLMSSTELADEETQQSIKIAEKEALEQTILEKSMVPRAKITHKGFEDIEDVHGEFARAREIETQREREKEEEERRERERKERLKAVEQQRQRANSLSMPPESPIVPSQSPITESWGAPPPLPSHILQHHSRQGSDDMLTSPIRPLFSHSMSDIIMSGPEPELNLADLINIDEDGTDHDGGDTGAGTSGLTIDTSASALGDVVSASSPLKPDGIISDQTPVSSHTLVTSPTSATQTGISPFASRGDGQRSLSFDLNSLWNGPKDDDISTTPKSPPPVSMLSAMERDRPAPPKDVVMEQELVAVANDDDFDMFLEEDTRNPRSSSSSVPKDPQVVFEAVPHCWTGKIHMPLDSAAPQATSVYARQIGGRALGPQDMWWKTLFPSEELRIDGRVPTKSSSEFLTQIRLNPAKELVAVAFSPVSDEIKTTFDALCDYLKSRDRHGLIFPWGQRPKDWAPGRELYLVPLSSNMPLPDYIELLDDLKLPKVRKADYMLGIWILGKGKLDHPPPASSTTPTASVPSTTQPIPPLPNVPLFMPPHMNPPPSHSPSVPPPHIPSLGSILGVPPIPSTAPGAPPRVDSAALAAEVATLTPEQIQGLLRTLASSNLPVGLPSQFPGGPSPPPPGPHSHGIPPPPHWPGMPLFPPPPGGLPPGPPPLGYPNSSPYPPAPPGRHPMHNPNDRDRDFSPQQGHGHSPHNGGERSGRHNDRDRERGGGGGGGGGWRGEGGGGRQNRRSGRGKNRGGQRHADSGWPRRQPNKDDNGSPARRW